MRYCVGRRNELFALPDTLYFYHSPAMITTITFLFFAGDIAIYSSLLLTTFLPFYFWWLFFSMLPPRDSYFNQSTFAQSFLSFWVVAAGLRSWLAWLFSWLQAVILTTDSYLINKWLTTLKRHGRIRQILLPSSPNNWNSCHRDESRMLSHHAKDDKRHYTTQKLTCVCISISEKTEIMYIVKIAD